MSDDEAWYGRSHIRRILRNVEADHPWYGRAVQRFLRERSGGKDPGTFNTVGVDP